MIARIKDTWRRFWASDISPGEFYALLAIVLGFLVVVEVVTCLINSLI